MNPERSQCAHEIDISYSIWSVPKKNGKRRIIKAPSDQLKRKQKEILERIPDSLYHDSAHGFRSNRSIYTNALPHSNSRYVLNIDIKNFFPSILKSMFFSHIKTLALSAIPLDEISTYCFLEGSLPQGAPSSPALANLYLGHLDETLFRFSSKHGLVYTRYADDLSFSSKDDWLKINAGLLIRCIDRELEKLGLNRSKHKTKLMPYYQRQEVTGLLVNGTKPRLSKRKRGQVFELLSGRDYTTLTESELGVFNFLREFDSRAYNKLCQTMTKLTKEEEVMATWPEYISRVKFFKTEGNGTLEGMGNFTVADSIAIKFSIFSNDGKMRMVLPSEKNPRFDSSQPAGKQNPKYYDLVYPISGEARSQLEGALIEELLSQRNNSNSMNQTIPF